MQVGRAEPLSVVNRRPKITVVVWRQRGATVASTSSTGSSATSSRRVVGAFRRARRWTWPRRVRCTATIARSSLERYEETANSDLVLITAGLAAQAGDDPRRSPLQERGIVAASSSRSSRDRRARSGLSRIRSTRWCSSREEVGIPARACVVGMGACSTGAVSHVIARELTCRSRTSRPLCWVATATPWSRCRATRRWPHSDTELLSAEKIQAW